MLVGGLHPPASPLYRPCNRLTTVKDIQDYVSLSFGTQCTSSVLEKLTKSCKKITLLVCQSVSDCENPIVRAFRSCVCAICCRPHKNQGLWLFVSILVRLYDSLRRVFIEPNLRCCSFCELFCIHSCASALRPLLSVETTVRNCSEIKSKSLTS